MLSVRLKPFTSRCAQFSSSCILHRKDPNIQAKKAFNQKRIERIKQSSPFKTNVGMKHQLNNFGLPDPKDPVFHNFGSNLDMDFMESNFSASEIYQKKLEKGIPQSELVDKEEVKRHIVRKKYLEGPKQPNLLTWMEKQIIRKLHKEDSISWTYEKLSECFPVTPRNVKYVIKAHTKNLKPEEIIKHDEKVRENWKLFKKNQLPHCEELQEHLHNLGHKIFESDNFLTNHQKQELEQKVWQDYQLFLEPPRPQLNGKFGSLLLRHKERLGLVPKKSEDSIEVKGLLDAQDDFHRSLNEPSPYGESTVINAIDTSRYAKKSLTVMQFREEFYKEMKKKARTDENAKKYLKWLKTERNYFDKQDENMEKLKELDIEGDKEEIDERKIQKYKKKDFVVLDKKPNVADEIQMKIDIPQEKVSQGAVYQVGNCFYDSNGEFMHRIPGL